MADILELINAMQRHHFPAPPAIEPEIVAAEQRLGIKLPSDMRTFLLNANGACFFRPEDPPYRILSANELCRARLAIFGIDDDEFGPSSWYAFCDVQDGNYAAVELGQYARVNAPVYDCFHEAFPDPNYCKVIAESFTGFLARMIASDGKLFWL
jgi:hypothetical protein